MLRCFTLKKIDRTTPRMFFASLFLAVILSVFSAPSVTSIPSAHAQTESLTITMTPKYPGPFETVNISVEDYSRDLNAVNITWTVNGVVTETGVGKKRQQVQTGALGSVTNITIKMGSEYKKLTLRPGVVDLLWQADTTTTPFYKGKALHSNQDPITVVAEPYFINSQGTRLDPNALIYKWKMNGVVNDPASGSGKKTFRIVPSILMKPSRVDVEVMSTDNSFRAVSAVTISDTKPEVVFYENHPLYGIIFNKALNNRDFIMTQDEVSIIAEPYYFSHEQADNNELSYNWNLNSGLVGEYQNQLTFRKPGSGSGRSELSLAVKNLERFMQAASANLYVQFDSESENSAEGVPIF